MIPPVQLDMQKRVSDQSLHLDLDGLDLGGSSRPSVKRDPTSQHRHHHKEATIPVAFDTAFLAGLPGPSSSSSRMQQQTSTSSQRVTALNGGTSFASSKQAQDDLLPCNGHVDSFMAHIREDCEDAHEILCSNTMLDLDHESPMCDHFGSSNRNALALDVHGQASRPAVETQSRRRSAKELLHPSELAHVSSQVLGGFASLGTSPPNHPKAFKADGSAAHHPYLSQHASPNTFTASGLAAMGGGDQGAFSSNVAGPSRWQSLTPVAEDPMRTLGCVPLSLLPKFNVDIKKSHQWDGAVLEPATVTTPLEGPRAGKKPPCTWTVARFTAGERQWFLAPAEPVQQSRKLSRTIRVRCRGADFQLTAPPRAFEGKAYFDIHSLDGEKVGSNMMVLTAAAHHRSFFHDAALVRSSGPRAGSNSLLSDGRGGAGGNCQATPSHTSAALGVHESVELSRKRSQSVGNSSNGSDDPPSDRSIRHTKSRPNLRYTRSAAAQGLARSSVDNLRRRSRLCDEGSPDSQERIAGNPTLAEVLQQKSLSKESDASRETARTTVSGSTSITSSPSSRDVKRLSAPVPQKGGGADGGPSERAGMLRKDASRLGGWLKKKRGVPSSSANASQTKTIPQTSNGPAQPMKDYSYRTPSRTLSNTTDQGTSAQHRLSSSANRPPQLDLYQRKGSVSEDDLLAHVSKIKSQTTRGGDALLNRPKVNRMQSSFASGFLRLSPTGAFFKTLSPPSSPSQLATDSENEDIALDTRPDPSLLLPETLRSQPIPSGLTLRKARLDELSDSTLCMFIPLPIQAAKDRNTVAHRYIRIAFIPFASAVPTSASTRTQPTPKSSEFEVLRTPGKDGWQDVFSFDPSPPAVARSAPTFEPAEEEPVIEHVFTSNRRSSFVQAFRVTALVIDATDASSQSGQPVSGGPTAVPECTPFPVVLAICFSGHSIDFVPEGWEMLGLAAGPVEAADSVAGSGQATNQSMLGVADIIVAACAAVMDV